MNKEKILEDLIYKSLKRLLLDEKVLETLLESTVVSSIKYLQETSGVSGVTFPASSLEGAKNTVKNRKNQEEDEEDVEEEDLEIGEDGISGPGKLVYAAKKTKNNKKNGGRRVISFLQQYVDENTIETAKKMKSDAKIMNEEEVAGEYEQIDYGDDSSAFLNEYNSQMNKELVSMEEISTLLGGVKLYNKGVKNG